MTYDGLMPRLACFICGRAIWATVPLAQLFVEERRCPRCGASLKNDRREADRRVYSRRKVEAEAPPTGEERRVGERRTQRRRRPA